MQMPQRKPLVILSGEIKTPPFSREARMETGFLLGKLQSGGSLGLPAARPMPDIGSRCLELRVKDKTAEWRIFCRVDTDAVLMAHVLSKKTQRTPKTVIALCKKRLDEYDRKTGGQ
jgi:phage-related protein